jgi:hypothetical protein
LSISARTHDLRRAAFGFALGATLVTAHVAPAQGQEPSAEVVGPSPRTAAGDAASAGSPTSARELPPLPKAPSLELRKPEADELEELDARLAGLTSAESEARDTAARELLEVEPRLVPAIAFRLRGLADRANKQAMKDLLERTRTKSREQERTRLRAAGDDSEVKTPDYLAMLVERPSAEKETYRDLISLVGMSRMLTQIGTVEAVRLLLEIYVRFGEFVRVDTQLQLARLGDKAVPALIEAERHPAEKIVHWARRQLDALGRGVPGEAIQTQDHQVLADVLIAYGRVRNPDATRIIVSFANSERAVVRDGARQAIALMGEVGSWQLRDSYENLMGKKPPRDWSWERTARELFREFDRIRDVAVADAFEAGRKARENGDLDGMRRAWGELLARDPDPERSAELVQGYLAFADKHFEDRPLEARESLLRAQRLSADPAQKVQIESSILTLRAVEAERRGIADIALLRRALELRPDNERAKAQLARLTHASSEALGTRTRWIAALVMALIALGGVVTLILRKKSPEPLLESHPPGEERHPSSN